MEEQRCPETSEIRLSYVSLRNLQRDLSSLLVRSSKLALEVLEETVSFPRLLEETVSFLRLLEGQSSRLILALLVETILFLQPLEGQNSMLIPKLLEETISFLLSLEEQNSKINLKLLELIPFSPQLQEQSLAMACSYPAQPLLPTQKFKPSS